MSPRRRAALAGLAALVTAPCWPQPAPAISLRDWLESMAVHHRYSREEMAQATGLALVPVALGAGQPGSEIQAPMAIVILSGLLSATVLNMVVVPAACWLFARRVVTPEAGTT